MKFAFPAKNSCQHVWKKVNDIQLPMLEIGFLCDKSVQMFGVKEMAWEVPPVAVSTFHSEGN
jgi:hypothetical protein